MRCGAYRRKPYVPKGASTAGFMLLSHDEQVARVKKLKASRLTDEAIAQLTGLGKLQISQMLEAK